MTRITALFVITLVTIISLTAKADFYTGTGGDDWSSDLGYSTEKDVATAETSSDFTHSMGKYWKIREISWNFVVTGDRITITTHTQGVFLNSAPSSGTGVSLGGGIEVGDYFLDMAVSLNPGVSTSSSELLINTNGIIFDDASLDAHVGSHSYIIEGRWEGLVLDEVFGDRINSLQGSIPNPASIAILGLGGLTAIRRRIR